MESRLSRKIPKSMSDSLISYLGVVHIDCEDDRVHLPGHQKCLQIRPPFTLSSGKYLLHEGKKVLVCWRLHKQAQILWIRIAFDVSKNMTMSQIFMLYFSPSKLSITSLFMLPRALGRGIHLKTKFLQLTLLLILLTWPKSPIPMVSSRTNKSTLGDLEDKCLP